MCCCSMQRVAVSKLLDINYLKPPGHDPGYQMDYHQSAITRSYEFRERLQNILQPFGAANKLQTEHPRRHAVLVRGTRQKKMVYNGRGAGSNARRKASGVSAARFFMPLAIRSKILKLLNNFLTRAGGSDARSFKASPLDLDSQVITDSLCCWRQPSRRPLIPGISSCRPRFTTVPCLERQVGNFISLSPVIYHTSMYEPNIADDCVHMESEYSSLIPRLFDGPVGSFTSAALLQYLTTNKDRHRSRMAFEVNSYLKVRYCGAVRPGQRGRPALKLLASICLTVAGNIQHVQKDLSVFLDP
ncbi:hypothetical protein B0H13DRAFT_2276700 [Mycena leptocephala]|nr:hypothetical protein B0H13DRAFT_2276700 [Mycena leptocephala]